MPDENLLATLQQQLQQSRTTRARLASRLADLEAEAERIRTELNAIDVVVSHTEQAMFRVLSSMMSAGTMPPPVLPRAQPTDAEIEAALQRDAQQTRQTPSVKEMSANARPAAVGESFGEVAENYSVPPLRENIEPLSDRFFDRTIPQAATVILREAGTPLHVNEIYNRLLEGGFQFTGQNPTISIAVSLNRNRRFRKVAPGTFDLTIRDASQASA
jgi:uncharacterized protein YhaN